MHDYGLYATTEPATYANQFYIKTSVSLSCADVAESVESWYDGSVTGKEKLRTEFYGGVDKYAFRNDLNFTWHINPQPSSTPACFTTGIRSYLLDLTGFVLQPNTVLINGVTCKNWNQLCS